MEILEKRAPFVSEVLKGIGQIMLQDNIWTGLLFLTGIFYDDLTMGFAAILATATGTLTARLLKYDPEQIRMGLYGFSAALVGVALTFMFQANAVIWGLVVIGASVATILQHFFIVKKIPVFTLPFILVTWVLVFCLHHFTSMPAPPSLIDFDIVGSEIKEFTTATNGYGEVIFQGSFVAGVLFVLGVFMSNPVASLYGLAGSIVGAWIASFYTEPLDQIHMGLFSFNAVLCSIVFAGLKRKDGVLVLVASVFAVLIEVYILKGNFGMLNKAGGLLTFPFVAGTWLTLPIKKFLYGLSDDNK